MPNPFEITLAYWQLDLLRGDQLPALAVAALEARLDSGSLRILAGLTDPTRDEAGPLLLQAAEEIGVAVPGRREAGFSVARDIARRILSDEVTPHVGARLIWTQVYNAIGQPDQLGPFVYLASELDDFITARPARPTEYDPLIAQCEAAIREEADRLVRGVAA